MEALILRATLKQSQHDFHNALDDLDLAVKMEPRNPQIWLTRATIYTVLGDSLNGDTSASTPEKIWALTILAETAERTGKHALAENQFKEAIALGQKDPYLLSAYADFLISQKRYEQAVTLLQNETRADGLLLRLAIAESKLPKTPASLKNHIEALRDRFESGHLRGDFVHQREEAIFTLHLLNDPAKALRLSLDNWKVQHEPADLRILLESALAAKRPEEAAAAIQFLSETKLEDVESSKLAIQLTSTNKISSL